MKKNKIPMYITIPILILILIIGMAMFISGDLKIFSWSIDARVIIVILWFLFSLFGIVAYYE